MKQEVLKILEPHLELASDKNQIIALEQQLRTITSSLQATIKYPPSDPNNNLFKKTINTILNFFDIPYECKKKDNVFSHSRMRSLYPKQYPQADRSTCPLFAAKNRHAPA